MIIIMYFLCLPSDLPGRFNGNYPIPFSFWLMNPHLFKNNLFKADYVQMCIEWTYSQPSHYRIEYGSVWYLVKSKPLRFLSLPYLRGPFIPLFSNQTSPLTAPTSIHKASPQNSKRFKKFQMLHSSDCFFFPEFSRTPKKLHSKLLSRLSVECVEI